MKTYKAIINSVKEYKVTKEDFENALKVNENLYQDGKYYGVCPYCDSPVKLIGLLREIKVSPYAQHTLNSVKNVADKTFETIFCPANTHRKEVDPEERLSKETNRSLKIKQFFIENFDIAAKIANSYSDIYYSKKEKIELFKNACKAKIWLFPEIDMSNLPWILLYLKSPESIKIRLIKKNSKLYELLNQKEIQLKDSFMENYVRIAPEDYNKVEHWRYSFTQHRRYMDKNDDYKETIHSMLTMPKHYVIPYGDGFYTFLDELIEIDHQEVFNKIEFCNKNNFRDTDLLSEIKKIPLE